MSDFALYDSKAESGLKRDNILLSCFRQGERITQNRICQQKRGIKAKRLCRESLFTNPKQTQIENK